MNVCEKSLTSVPILTPKGAEGGQLYFLPADLGLYQRINETRSAFLRTLAVLPDATINPDGTGADPASVEILAEAEQQFMELLNYVCAVETSPEALRQYRPFAAMSDGRFWASCVMAAFDKALDTVAANIKQIQTKMNTNGGKKKWKSRK